MATVYAVASAKGGVGKTTTTAAIATILADSGADVVAIDADIGMANLAGAVGVTPGETTLHDVLAGRADPSDAVHEGPSGLRVVPGSSDLDAYAAADPSGLKAVIDAFDDADYVFVDAGAGLSHDSTLPLGLADETLLVSTAERSALGDTEKTRQFAERIGGAVAGAAITRVAADGDTDDDDIAETLDAAVLGRIPEDDAVLRAVDASEPLPTFAPEAPATRAYRDLTRALTGADVEGEGLDGGVAAGSDGSDGSDDADESDETGDADEEGDDDSTEEADEADEDADEDDEADEDAGEDDEADGDAGEDDETSEQPERIEEAEAIEEPDAAEEPEAIPDADDEARKAGEVEEGDEADGDDTEDVDGTGDGDEDGEGREGEDDGHESEDDDGHESEDDDGHESEDDGAVAESEPPGNGIGDETETVGERHVGAEDLEAMVEEEVGEAERFDAEAGRSTDDETSTADDETAAEADVDTETTDDGETVDAEAAASSGSESDLDDELEGSVPFRDDDTGGVGSVRSDEDAEGDGADDESETEGRAGAEDGDEPDAGDETEEEATEEDSRGFFSRLLGR